MNTSVLILDADRWQRETLAAALAYEGFQAEHTGEATFAMGMLARHRFQLLLLDPLGPATGGWPVIHRVALMHPALPVLVVTSSEEQPRPAVLAGACGIIRKPVGFPVLLAAIRRTLSMPAETDMFHRIERETGLPGRSRGLCAAAHQ